MPYYRGDYYRGDYYGNYAAGGLFGTLGKLAGKVVGSVVRATPLGAVASALIPTFNKPQLISRPAQLMIGPGTGMSVPEPGITGTVHRLAPGGHPGYGRYKKDGTWTERRRPRLNPLNPRALKRALRREAGFLKFARKVGHFAGIKGTFKLKRTRKR
jgi:hypothetical protein